ncbi:hypothetical protein SODG_005096 [Sodalis praecaptivus]
MSVFEKLINRRLCNEQSSEGGEASTASVPAQVNEEIGDAVTEGEDKAGQREKPDAERTESPPDEKTRNKAVRQSNTIFNPVRVLN